MEAEYTVAEQTFDHGKNRAVVDSYSSNMTLPLTQHNKNDEP